MPPDGRYRGGDQSGLALLAGASCCVTRCALAFVLCVAAVGDCLSDSWMASWSLRSSLRWSLQESSSVASSVVLVLGISAVLVLGLLARKSASAARMSPLVSTSARPTASASKPSLNSPAASTSASAVTDVAHCELRSGRPPRPRGTSTARCIRMGGILEFGKACFCAARPDDEHTDTVITLCLDCRDQCSVFDNCL